MMRLAALAASCVLLATAALAQQGGGGGGGGSGTGGGPSLPMLQSTAAEASHVFKTAAGTLSTLGVTNTLNAGFILLVDGTAVPADGALTSCGTGNPSGCLKACFPIGLGTASAPVYGGLQSPITFANGIVVVYSSTGCNTKTIGAANVFFQAQVY